MVTVKLTQEEIGTAVRNFLCEVKGIPVEARKLELNFKITADDRLEAQITFEADHFSEGPYR